MKSIRTNDNQLPKSVSTDKVGPQQIIRLKGWCELYTRLIETIPEIWNELDKKQNKEDRLDRLIRDFSQEEREDDTVDIHIDDRMGTCIVKGRFVATLEYNYSTYHHGLTTFATSLRGVEESTEQQLEDDAQRLMTTKTIADVERSRGNPPSIVTDYYTLTVWVKNYTTVLLNPVW